MEKLVNEQITLLNLSAGKTSATPLSRALPPDLYEQVRARVRLLAILSATGFGLGPAIFLMIAAASTVLGPLHAEFWGGAWFTILNTIGIVLSIGLWSLARTSKVSAERLLTLGQIYHVATCLVLGVLTYWSEYREFGQIPALTWIPAVVILFPLIMPGPPRRMLWGAIAAGATAPLALALLDTMGAVVTSAAAYISAILNSGLAVGFAHIGARTVYGLGKKVVEARQMGSYQLEKLLGRGGMGEVWRANHRMLARPAAIKLIRPEILNANQADPEIALRRFEREAHATAGLRSPHTVELYDFGVTDDRVFYYVMELLDGLDAATLVERFGPLPANRTVFLVKQICQSLSEAHTRGLIHRDIKPGNIYVCRYGEEFDFVKVLDFGLVKLDGSNDDGPHLTAEFVGGTPTFIAPEQALGNRELDARADVYALGCVTYWMLTGEYVFKGTTAIELITQHVHDKPVPVSQRMRETITREQENIIMACLAKEPDERPESVRSLLHVLDELHDIPVWTHDNARDWWREHVPDINREYEAVSDIGTESRLLDVV